MVTLLFSQIKNKISNFRKKGDHFDSYKYFTNSETMQSQRTCREEFYFSVLSSGIHLAKHGCLKCVSELINMSLLYSQQNETSIFLSSVSQLKVDL